ncbi:hypothetical protein BKA70DRAFT_1231915 [Coprinopsis sp. MPI-PUGE-AT-0042]|nr:hypothetical protein BKA70DRAFT_1231915 [Coprinopsis sp. MPI-PUGE-AT-0042]
MPKATHTRRAALREQALRDDSLCKVLSKLWVCCRMCGADIKLSPKMVFDPHHWVTHRRRCQKPKRRRAAVVKRSGSCSIIKVEPDFRSSSQTSSFTESQTSSGTREDEWPLASTPPECIFSSTLTSPPETPPAGSPVVEPNVHLRQSNVHIVTYCVAGVPRSDTDRWSTHEASTPLAFTSTADCTFVPVKGLPNVQSEEELDDRDLAIWLTLLHRL